MFQLTQFTQATITSVTNRQETHGDDRKPAVTVGLKIEAANTMLDEIDPQIRHALYKAVDGQTELEGVEPTTPVLRCNSFDAIALTTAHEGWTLLLDDNLDEEDPMTFGGVKVDKLRVDAKQGGSIVLSFRCGTSDVDAERLGALGMRNGQDVWIQLLPPKKAPPVIDGTAEAFAADHPDATGLFADGTDPDDAAAQFHADLNGPDDDPANEGEGNAPDAAAQEQAELEAGMSKALAGAGVKPARGRKVPA